MLKITNKRNYKNILNLSLYEMTLEISQPCIPELKPLIDLQEEADKVCSGWVKTYTKTRRGKPFETYTYILGSDVSNLQRWGRIPKGEYEGWKRTSKSIDGRVQRIYVKL
jgi:hypothetical protein